MFVKSKWFRNVNVRSRKIAGKNLLINIKNNRLLILDEQARAIWDQIDGSKLCKELDIAKALQYKYNGASIKKLQEDIHNLLVEFQNKGFAHQDDKIFPQSISYKNGKSKASGHLSFSEKFHQIAAQYNIPISAGFEITQRCDLKCLHCYIDNQPISYDNELSTKEICNLLDQMVESGCLWLLITGGEPLLRKDFCEIYRYAKELGLIITVFTNAINITEKIADTFVEYPPFLVEATLHGATEVIFDTISRIPGSFRRFQNGIQHLRERKILFHLKMIVMRQNVHEVESTGRLAVELGADDFRFDPMVNADFYHSFKATNLRISVNEAIKLDLLEPYKNRWKKIYRTALRKKMSRQSSKELLFPCRAGKCSFTISANGQLLPCVLMRVPAYNLREMSFLEAWKKLNHYATTAYTEENNLCLKCSVQTCSKCPAWGYLEHNDPNTKSQFACILQQEREKNFFSNPK